MSRRHGPHHDRQPGEDLRKVERAERMTMDHEAQKAVHANREREKAVAESAANVPRAHFVGGRTRFEKPRRTRQTWPVICQVPECGREFESPRPDVAKYCSRACRLHAAARMKREKNFADRIEQGFDPPQPQELATLEQRRQRYAGVNGVEPSVAAAVAPITRPKVTTLTDVVERLDRIIKLLEDR